MCQKAINLARISREEEKAEKPFEEASPNIDGGRGVMRLSKVLLTICFFFFFFASSTSCKTSRSSSALCDVAIS